MIETTLFIVICIGLVIGVIVAFRKSTDRLRFTPKPITPTPKECNAFFTITPNADGTWEAHKLTMQELQKMPAAEVLRLFANASAESSKAMHDLRYQEVALNEHKPK